MVIRVSYLFGLLIGILPPSVVLGVTFPVDPTVAFGRILSEMHENEWSKLNINRFDTVWTPRELVPSTPGNFFQGSPRSVIQAWSSMAWDPNRGDLIFFGGGHANYTGNDVYRWRSSTLEWERASLPTNLEFASYGSGLFRTVDGELNSPLSAHTYDNSEFLPLADRFVSFGGATIPSGNAWLISDGQGGSKKTGPYFWDPSKADGDKVGGLDGSGVDPATLGGRMWENRDNLVPADGGRYPGDFWGSFVEGTTALSYEPGLANDVLYVADLANLWRYTVNNVNDPSLDTYEHLGSTWDTISGQGAGAFDYIDNIYLRTAESGAFSFWDLNLDSGGLVVNQLFVPIDPGNTFDMANLGDFGLDYDPVRNRFVMWGGDGSLWELHVPENPQLDDWVIQEIVPIGLLMPDSNALVTDTRGILGKWKYIPGLDVFLGVEDSTTGDIWAYKPVGWSPEVRPQWLPAADISVSSSLWLMLPLLAGLGFLSPVGFLGQRSGSLDIVMGSGDPPAL